MSKTLEEIITSPSLVRENWLSTELAVREVLEFERRFGPKHLKLACHAALPLILSPELVNLIHLNFLEGEGIPWVAEVDLLLSPLCRPVDKGLYEVEPAIREVLLVELENQFAWERPFELANFLQFYLANKMGLKLCPQIIQTQRWIAQAYLDPDSLVEEIRHSLDANLSEEDNKFGLPAQIQVINILELLVEPLEATNKREEYQYLVDNSRLLAQLIYEDEQQLEGKIEKPPLSLLSPVLIKVCNKLRERTVTLSPYRGLLAFREEDAQFFFGREIFVQRLVETVQIKQLVAVIGSSGSGKSSVVFAGLIPQLRSQQNWLIVSLRPGERPFWNLAAQLVTFIELQISEAEQLVEVNKLNQALQQRDLELEEVITHTLEKNNYNRFLLVIDQFEELYTLCREQLERQKFLDCLLNTIQQNPNFQLVLTMRADFLGYALSYPPLVDILQNASVFLSSMTHEELKDVIEKPAQMLGLEIESGVTERILQDVENEPGILPLLEFTLTQLWERRNNNMLTHQAYEQIGGIQTALVNYAENIYNQLTEAEQKQAKRIFLQLVRLGEGIEDTRRVATRLEIGEENWNLVNYLANARLVVIGRNETGEETVEIVHEALIQQWSRLMNWLQEEREFLLWLKRLKSMVQEWEYTHRDEGALLRGVLLAEAETRFQEKPEYLSLLEQDFIQQSFILRDRNNSLSTSTEVEENIFEKGLSYLRNLLRPKTYNIPLDIPGNQEIRIVGPRGSGKTTFMAALSYFTNASNDSPIQSIAPVNHETMILIEKAQNILMQGMFSAPTAPISADRLSLYEILITLKPRFFSNPIATVRRQNIRLSVSCREYPGELIQDLSQSYEKFSLKDYLDDCASTLSLMLLIDPSSYRQDNEYALGFKRLFGELEQRLVQQNADLSHYRIAVAFSKCELPEVFFFRHQPKRIISTRFPQTYRCLQEWEVQWNCSLAYFAYSAFGTIGSEYPEPNCQVIGNDDRGFKSVIKNPQLWKPFGLIAPIYWLYTGKHDSRLEDF